LVLLLSLPLSDAWYCTLEQLLGEIRLRLVNEFKLCLKSSRQRYILMGLVSQPCNGNLMNSNKILSYKI